MRGAACSRGMLPGPEAAPLRLPGTGSARGHPAPPSGGGREAPLSSRASFRGSRLFREAVRGCRRAAVIPARFSGARSGCGVTAAPAVPEHLTGSAGRTQLRAQPRLLAERAGDRRLSTMGMFAATWYHLITPNKAMTVR